MAALSSAWPQAATLMSSSNVACNSTNRAKDSRAACSARSSSSCRKGGVTSAAAGGRRGALASLDAASRRRGGSTCPGKAKTIQPSAATNATAPTANTLARADGRPRRRLRWLPRVRGAAAGLIVCGCKARCSANRGAAKPSAGIAPYAGSSTSAAAGSRAPSDADSADAGKPSSSK